MTRERGFPRPPLPIVAPRADHFPTTALTTLLDQLRHTLHGEPSPRGSPAHLRMVETLMARYAGPLEVYARGSSLRDIAEPADLVHGFFAAALADPAYLARYQASGMRLRRYLMNGLLLHARSVARDRSRQNRREGGEMPPRGPAATSSASPEHAYDRAWALAILSEACGSVEAALLAEGRDHAWTVFRRHAIDGRSYADLERELGLGKQQMADLVRSVTRRLRGRMLELLEAEGGDAAEELRDVLRFVQ